MYDWHREQMEPMLFASNKRHPKRALMATNDYEHTPDEFEFLKAMGKYIIESGNQFPSWSEALHIVKSLGYHK
jgi:hypothetical protein